MNRMVVLVLTVAVVACSRGASQTIDAVAPVSVRVADVVHEDVVRPVRATGVVGPKEEVALSFKVGGVVGAVRVDAGDVVRAGQVLAVLELSEIDASVVRAESGLAKAERDLERARRLYRDSVVTLAQLQDAETGADVARADAEATRFNRRYAVITAPADGVILRRTAEAGELVSPGVPVLVLGSRARGTVIRAGLADRDVVRIRRGDEARVTFDAFAGQVFTGTLSEVGAAAHPGTGTYAVEIALPGGGALAAGMIGTIEILPAQRATAQLVPLAAVLEADGTQGSVYVLSGDGREAERRSVTIGFMTGDRVAIISGLEDVQRVITDGAAFLYHGAAVTVIP